MLVELGLVEQRLAAVVEVLRDGASVTGVARRYGVARQRVHEWLKAYAAMGLRGLADRSSKPLSCPHQTKAGGAGIVAANGVRALWRLPSSGLKRPASASGCPAVA